MHQNRIRLDLFACTINKKKEMKTETISGRSNAFALT